MRSFCTILSESPSFLQPWRDAIWSFSAAVDRSLLTKTVPSPLSFHPSTCFLPLFILFAIFFPFEVHHILFRCFLIHPGSQIDRLLQTLSYAAYHACPASVRKGIAWTACALWTPLSFANMRFTRTYQSNPIAPWLVRNNEKLISQWCYQMRKK